jgi:hypothetical protein
MSLLLRAKEVLATQLLRTYHPFRRGFDPDSRLHPQKQKPLRATAGRQLGGAVNLLPNYLGVFVGFLFVSHTLGHILLIGLR